MYWRIFSLGRYFTVNEDNSLVDKVVSKNLHIVQNCDTTSAVAALVNAEDKIPTTWFYLQWDFFPQASLIGAEQKPIPLLQLFDFHC